MKKVALVGRPNVGKSTLYNRFSRSYDAVTSDIAGTTRDVRVGVARFGGKTATLIDTGGLEDRNELFRTVRDHAVSAASEADIVLFMVDAQELPQEHEKKLFFELQKKSKSIALVLNKMDNSTQTEQFFAYMSFGAAQSFAISCAHKTGFEPLEKWIADQLDDDEAEALPSDESETVRVGIIGRPNVGKSSLLNALVGFERSVVSPVAGTTLDPVDETVQIDGRRIVFVDTAGIRKRSRIEGIERYAFDRTEKMLEITDIALLVLDASEDFCELDERIAGLCDKHKTAVIIVLNKYDIAAAEFAKLEKTVRDKFVFLSFAPIISLSANTKKRVNKLYEMIFAVYENYARRIPTSQLNSIIEAATLKHHLPSVKGKVVKIYYAAQFESKPPKIALIANRPKSIHFSYLRYLSNQIRQAVELNGTPIILETKAKSGHNQAEID